MFVPLTPIRCLHRAVDLFGCRTGIVSGARQFTYAQFGERAERLATGLVAAGIQPAIGMATTSTTLSSSRQDAMRRRRRAMRVTKILSTIQSRTTRTWTSSLKRRAATGRSACRGSS